MDQASDPIPYSVTTKSLKWPVSVHNGDQPNPPTIRGTYRGSREHKCPHEDCIYHELGFDRPKKLQRHKNSKHERKEVWVCPRCDAMLSDKWSLGGHLTSQHDLPRELAAQCKKILDEPRVIVEKISSRRRELRPSASSKKEIVVVTSVKEKTPDRGVAIGSKQTAHSFYGAWANGTSSSAEAKCRTKSSKQQQVNASRSYLIAEDTPMDDILGNYQHSFLVSPATVEDWIPETLVNFKSSPYQHDSSRCPPTSLERTNLPGSITAPSLTMGVTASGSYLDTEEDQVVIDMDFDSDFDSFVDFTGGSGSVTLPKK